MKNYNTKGIARSVELVFKSRNIDYLTKDAYSFLMNMSGFIAHYNIGGFKAHYENVSDLARDINRSSDVGRPLYWIESFFVDKYGMEYCASKVDTIIAVAELAKKYGPILDEIYAKKAVEADIALARALLAKHNITA